MTRGWSVNLSERGHDVQVELPSVALFETSQGPVVELVFYSETAKRWMHAVGSHFFRELPEGHVQVTIGDLTWLTQIVNRLGDDGLRQCVDELAEAMLPEWAD